MKKKKDKELIIFIILIPIFLFVAFQIVSRMDNELPQYSVLNKSQNGCSVFFEALKDFNYSIERTLKPVTKQDRNTVQIVASNYNFDIEDKDLKKWIENGGTLIYLSKDYSEKISDFKLLKRKETISLYQHGLGFLVVADINDITNAALMKDTDNAYEVLKLIDSYYSDSDKKVYINESYMFLEQKNESLWGSLPLGVKLVCYQMLLIIIAFIYYKGKRFGKAIPLYEEVERSENEYLYSAASLYRQNNCWDIMLENYYKNFLRQTNRERDQWLSYWEEEKLPNLNEAKFLYDFMNNELKNDKFNKKDYMQVVSVIEKLTNILKKRREEYWTGLKRI